MITANTMFASQSIACECNCESEIGQGEQYVMVKDRSGFFHIIKPECSFEFLKRLEGQA